MVKKLSAVIALTVLLAGCSGSNDSSNQNLSENQSQDATQVASVDQAQQSVMGSTSPSTDTMQKQDSTSANTNSTDANAQSTNNGGTMQGGDQSTDSATAPAPADDENSDQE